MSSWELLCLRCMENRRLFYALKSAGSSGMDSRRGNPDRLQQPPAGGFNLGVPVPRGAHMVAAGVAAVGLPPERDEFIETGARGVHESQRERGRQGGVGITRPQHDADFTGLRVERHVGAEPQADGLFIAVQEPVDLQSLVIIII